MDAARTKEFLEKLRASITGTSCDPREQIKQRVEEYNSSKGTLNLEDGFNCDKCQNRGMFAYTEEAYGYLYERYRKCECMKIRASIARMKRSGLETQIKLCRFDNFQCEEAWQENALKTAMDYAQDSEGKWLAMLGQVGAGKTHLCTAVCRELLLQGFEVYYAMWREEMAALKRAMQDPDEYTARMGKLINSDVLYLDDLYKPAQGEGITASDIKLTYDIINARYVKRLRTIISGELMISEMLDRDEATASRIAQMSKGYQVQIGRVKGRNWRLRDDGQAG